MAGEKLLTDAQCKAAKPKEKIYYLNDGSGLRLRVSANGSRVWLLRYHLGGKEQTVSRTPEGKARQIAANTKHGRETRAIREERSAKLAELYELEMLGRELGLISGEMVGRKPLKR